MLASSPLSPPTASPEPTPTQGQTSPFSLLSQAGSRTTRKYCPVKPLPYELQERCRIFFEENLHLQALSLLTALFTCGFNPTDPDDSFAVFVPPPTHIALIATLAVHPSMTTKTVRPERVQSSIEALQYLRLLHSSVGPSNAALNNAYAFPDKLRLTRRGEARRGELHGEEKSAHDAITLEMAEAGSLWIQAGDFWSVVGWAFNCSLHHPKRWDVWLPWLEHVITALEDDWAERKSSDTIDQSLVINYLGEPQSRRILRAVFADGGKQSLQEFHEVWKRETVERKERSATYEKVRVDFETEEFGNYFNVSSEASSEDEGANAFANGFDGANDDSDENVIDAIANPTIPDGAAALGGAHSVALRMRFLALLLPLSFAVPDRLTDAEALVGLFITYARSYSLSTFASMITPTLLESFTLPTASFLVQSLAGSLLEGSARRPNMDNLTQRSLEENYLPWAANTTSAGDNAKLAACIETLMRLYDKQVGLKWTTKLENAAKQGIERRENKVQRSTRGKGEGANGVGAHDLTWLQASGHRIGLLLKLVYRNSDTRTVQIR